MTHGMQGHIGLAKETVWGTAVAAAYYFEALSESVRTDIERFETRNIISGLYEPDDQDGLRRHAGDIVLHGHPESIGHFLMGTMGINSTTVILSGFLHRNAFRMRTSEAGSLNSVTPYTLEIARGSITTAFRYAGSQFNTLNIGAAVNQDIRFTVGLLAKARTVITRTTPTFPGSPRSPFTFKTSSLSLYGAAATHLQGVNIAIANQLEGVGFLDNTTEIGAVRRTGAQQIRLSGTAEFRDHTDVDAFMNQTEFVFQGNWTMASSFALLVYMPRVVLTGYPVVAAGRERITVDFQAMARYHTGSGHACEISLTTVNTF